MKQIDTEKLSKEMNDTLIHRACVMRSGMYLARYLIHRSRSVDAIRLLVRCSIHDISKMQNTEEFMSLASIVDQIDTMHDIKHVLSEEQENAIRLHRKRNSHHPEYYDSPNDMSDLDLLEMACDCHARSKQYHTNLLEYIEIQQDLRFHFDNEHYRKLRTYCMALVELTKNDDFSEILNENNRIRFDLKDSTMNMLENFDEDCYIDCIKTDRLYLRKESTPDFASVGYAIYLREDNTEIGYISVKFNNYIEYKIYENFIGNGYTLEAMSKFIETSTMNELYVVARKGNECAKTDLEKLGFKPMEATETTITYRYKKPTKVLEKRSI